MTSTPEARDDLDYEKLRSWGFAPGSYWCFCADCGKAHTADKRARRCIDCAEVKAGIATADQQSALEAVIAKAKAEERERVLALVLDEVGYSENDLSPMALAAIREATDGK